MANSVLIEADAADHAVSLRDLRASATAIRQIHEFFFHSDELGQFSFNVQTSEQIDDGKYPALFANTLVLGENVYGYALRWSRLVRQFGGLAKVDRVGFYAASCSVISAVA
jgi:hypothetical protein